MHVLFPALIPPQEMNRLIKTATQENLIVIYILIIELFQLHLCYDPEH